MPEAGKVSAFNYIHVGGTAEQMVRLETPPPRVPGTVRVVCVADTHLEEATWRLPQCDLLLHAGDILFRSGTSMSKQAAGEAYAKFCKWLAAQPCMRGALICGNHDMKLKEMGREALEAQLPPHFVYLENELVELLGLRVFGSPNSTGSSQNSAWQNASDKASWPGLEAAAENGPIDIVMAHGPAQYYDRKRKGVSAHERLVRRLGAVDAQVHLCGHLHWAYGLSRFARRSSLQGYSVCCSVMDGSYEATQLPVMLDIMPRFPARPAAAALPPPPPPPPPAPVAKDASVAVVCLQARNSNHTAMVQALLAHFGKAAVVVQSADAVERAVQAGVRAVVGVGDRSLKIVAEWPEGPRKAVVSGALCSRRASVHEAGIGLLTYSRRDGEGWDDVADFVEHGRAFRPRHDYTSLAL